MIPLLTPVIFHETVPLTPSLTAVGGFAQQLVKGIPTTQNALRLQKSEKDIIHSYRHMDIFYFRRSMIHTMPFNAGRLKVKKPGFFGFFNVLQRDFNT